MATLYKFQQDAVDNLLNGKHIIISSTGSGKSAMAMKFAEQMTEQTGKRKILVVTTASKSRACFIKGTKVSTPKGEKNIEDIKVGDIVLSYDGQRIVGQRVYDTLIKNNKKKLYRIDFCGGCNIIGTEDHPFYIGDGRYKEMSQLKIGDIIYGIRSQTKRSREKAPNSNGEVLQFKPKPNMLNMPETNADPYKSTTGPVVEKRNFDMLCEVQGDCEKDRQAKRIRKTHGNKIPGRSSLHGLRESDDVRRHGKKPKSLLLQVWSSVLFKRMFPFSDSRYLKECTSTVNPCRENTDSKEDGGNASQKQFSYKPATKKGERNVRLGDGVCSGYRRHLCKNRYSIAHGKNRDRDRRQSPRQKGTQGVGQDKGQAIKGVRVENIQILGQDECDENCVYCISVEDSHNFFANGILVHNCNANGDDDFTADARLFCSSSFSSSLSSSLSLISWHKLSAWVNQHWGEIEEYIFIFDELAKAKAGVSSGMGKAFLKITKRTTDWAGFTATPGENWLHYYPYFVACGLARNKTSFMHEYANVQTFKGYPEIVGWRHEDELRDMWAKISYAPDTSKVMAELPAETHKIVEFKKSPVYRKVLRTRYTEDGEMLDTTMALCHYLRQLCFTKPKQEWIKDFVENLGERAVIFYSYTEEGDKLEEICKKATSGKVWRIDGKHHDIPTEDTCGERDVVLCQWQSGSEGLNFQFISQWVSVSPTYSYATSIQARGRVKRIGAKRPIFYWYLKCEDCIESDVYKALKAKQSFSEDNWAIDNNLIEED